MPKRCPIGSCGQNQALRAHVWAGTARKRPKRGSEDKKWPKQEGKPKIIYTPRLADNAPFAHVGAPRGGQSVLLYVHMTKTRHSGRMSGRKTARKRPKRDRIWISATRTGRKAENYLHTQVGRKCPFCPCTVPMSAAK